MRRNRILLLPVLLCALFGCRRAAPAKDPPLSPAFALVPSGGERLLGKLSAAKLSQDVIASYMKAVWGRPASLGDVERVDTVVRPIVQEAAQQLACSAYFERLARRWRVSAAEVRQHWVDVQCGDLLLESGGDKDGYSPAGAAGVAQWMPDTGSGEGLHIRLAASNALTARILDLDRQIAWLRYLQAPGCDPSLPGAPAIGRTQCATELPSLLHQRSALAARRRSIDARFDPRASIFAQTRYLLRLCFRFPSLDWVYQAYHGGVGGAERLLRYWRSGGSRGQTGAPSFQQFYAETTPARHRAAFAYLYRRGDDDRHYWWKVQSAVQALDRYRSDPNAFAAAWKALLPGRRMEAVWYPNGPTLAVGDAAQIASAAASGLLQPVKSRFGLRVRPQPLAPAGSEQYSELRPQALGALYWIARGYRQLGGKGGLEVGDLMLTPGLIRLQKALYPPRPRGKPWPPDLLALAMPGGGPAADFNYHETGLAFDLLLPPDLADREILAYALGYLSDRGMISVILARDDGETRYHVCPCPRFGQQLARIAFTGKPPNLEGV